MAPDMVPDADRALACAVPGHPVRPKAIKELSLGAHKQIRLNTSR